MSCSLFSVQTEMIFIYFSFYQTRRKQNLRGMTKEQFNPILPTSSKRTQKGSSLQSRPVRNLLRHPLFAQKRLSMANASRSFSRIACHLLLFQDISKNSLFAIFSRLRRVVTCWIIASYNVAFSKLPLKIGFLEVPFSIRNEQR